MSETVDVYLRAVRSWPLSWGGIDYRGVGLALADEIERLRWELVCANAEQERLENQLDSVRSELVAATVKLDEWERVGLVAADLKELFRNDKIPPRGHIDALGRERLP